MGAIGIRTSVAVGTFLHSGFPPFAGLEMNGDRVIAFAELRDLCRALALPIVDAQTNLTQVDQWAAALQVAADGLPSPTSPAACTASNQKERRAAIPGDPASHLVGWH